MAATADSPLPPVVGIVGAGQLARMTCLAAAPLEVRTVVLGRDGEPATGVANASVDGDWNDAAAVAALGSAVGVVTLENEFVEASALAAVEAAGTPVRPGAAAVGVIQDKALQKERLRGAGLPVPRFVVADGPNDLPAVGRDLGWPLVLKSRKLGYDGYGNATCGTPEEAREAWGRLDRGEGVLVEEFMMFRGELAAMVARSTTGEEAVYPVVETYQRDHVCNEVVAPARVDPDVRARAREIALTAARAGHALGVMGVEMFLMGSGDVLVNELAPRPHNTGHYTIEACETSQFENHVRGILGWPLGPVQMRAPAAAMVNILGTRTGPSTPDRAAALAVAGAHLHLYGKEEVRVRRKMGHVTALAATADEALATARAGVRAVAL